MKVFVPQHKRKIKGTWRKVKSHKRKKRPSHGRKLKRVTKTAKITYYIDQYGQISPKGRKWRIIK